MRLESVSSRYWFEINSNVVATNKSPEAVRKLQDFRDGLDRIFLSKNVLKFIDIIDQEDLEDQIPKQKLISKIDSQAVIEVGPARGFLHAHILVTIIHRTTLRFTTNWIARYFNLKYKDSFYVSPGRIKPDLGISFIRYMEKTMKKMPR